jgi:hypothetical protein
MQATAADHIGRTPQWPRIGCPKVGDEYGLKIHKLIDRQFVQEGFKLLELLLGVSFSGLAGRVDEFPE